MKAIIDHICAQEYSDHEMIMGGKIFGKPSSVVHVVEFQKRGLPHTHFLIILTKSYKYRTNHVYDRFVTAELPDKDEDPYLYNLLVKQMMHGPYGNHNPHNVCMRDCKCKNHYMKCYSEVTNHGKGNYPIYCHRDDGRRAKVRGKMLDNSWVIPYNAKLLLHFNCHVNVEICCEIREVKYLYKYVHKGHDKIRFRIEASKQSSMSPEVNEITDFQNARWVSPVEATWRIYGFFLYGMYPSVMSLQVNLPNFHSIQFEEDSNLEEIIESERNKRTMLTEFFRISGEISDAKRLNLLYKYFPMHYVWDGQLKKWTKRNTFVVMGRLCVVHPVENEWYYLRVLLSNVCCPMSFEDLLTVAGITYDSFREATYKRGLLHNDLDMENTLEEASTFGMPVELRRLFSALLYYCKQANPRRLFEHSFSQLEYDFMRVQQQLQISDTDVLRKVLQGINDTLETLGTDVNDYHLTTFRYFFHSTAIPFKLSVRGNKLENRVRSVDWKGTIHCIHGRLDLFLEDYHYV